MNIINYLYIILTSGISHLLMGIFACFLLHNSISFDEDSFVAHSKDLNFYLVIIALGNLLIGLIAINQINTNQLKFLLFVTLSLIVFNIGYGLALDLDKMRA